MNIKSRQSFLCAMEAGIAGSSRYAVIARMVAGIAKINTRTTAETADWWLWMQKQEGQEGAGRKNEGNPISMKN